MKILIDCDGVLANFNKKCLDRLNKEHGLDILESDIKEWNWTKGHPKIPPEALKQLLNEWAHEKDFCASMEVFPGAQEAVEELRKIGHVVCVTSPWHSDFWVNERNKWLYDHFKLGFKDVIQTSGKEHIWGHMLIDDKPQNITEWYGGEAQEHLRGSKHFHGMLWAQPYNVGVVGPLSSPSGTPYGWTRTGSWAQVFTTAMAIKDRFG